MAGKTLIMIHGRNYKPPRDKLRKLWLDAVKGGLQRDRPDAMADFDRLRIEFVYYGDVSNRFLSQHSGNPVVDDSRQRRRTLNDLLKWTRRQFTKANYDRLPGKESLKEGVADALGPLLSFFRLSEGLIETVAPNMAEYWSDETEYGSLVRMPLIRPLKTAMDRGDSIGVLAHSLGTMIAYDTFWKFSHYGEYFDYWEKKVDLFISLGSPLGDKTVQRHLKGHGNTGARRYPKNIVKWVNVSAEDDYICHDERIANDFKAMKRLRLVRSMRDVPIYNLSVREGKSNPHHISGYLVHPQVVKTLADWMGG
jgi:hypothetical protein